jgi:hypothetical protein
MTGRTFTRSQERYAAVFVAKERGFCALCAVSMAEILVQMLLGTALTSGCRECPAQYRRVLVLGTERGPRVEFTQNRELMAAELSQTAPAQRVVGTSG